MALNSQLYYLIPSSTSNIYSRQRHIGIRFFYKEVVSFDKVVCCCATNKQKHILGCRCSGFRKRWPLCQRAKRKPYFIQRASMDDEVMVNGVPQASSSGEMQELRLKLDQSLQGEDISTGLVQSLHDAARAIELAILEHSSSFKTSWISKAWLGVDKNAWVKTLSYQAAVYSLLQAAVEISSLGDGRDGDVNVFVQRSLLRQSGSLESVIREELSYNQPAAYDWFWSQQYPMVVATFVNLFQRDPCFRAATTICWKGMPSGSGSANDLSLLMLALSCIAAVTKLGPAKVSCPQFFSMVPDISGKLMDMLVDFVPVQKAYYSLKEIGLRREFLLHFGPRAAACRVLNDHDVEEMAFWIDLVQKQLQRAIDRERIWSRLTTCECIEVLEKDLAIFGFFIALGRSTQSFVSANGLSTMDNPIESIIRYFIGGSVLYYPQLSSISSYQLYVEVVCEELDWLPFYGTNVVATKAHHENQSQVQGLPYGEVISQILDVCSHWTKSFVKYSLWLENPSNIKAAKFLSRGHSKLKDCEQELFAPKNEIRESDEDEVERTKLGSYSYSMEEKGLDTFDKALENVDEAIDRLEGLLQELHLSNSSTGKEHLEAACSDLERIRKLKKEAEFLEASFRAKAASLEEGNNEEKTQPSLNKKRQYPKRRKENASSKRVSGGSTSERVGSRGLLEFLRRQSTKKMEPEYSTGNENEDGTPKQVSDSDNCNKSSELSEIRRFEVLRCELIELEKRVQRSTVESYSDKDYNVLENRKTYVVVPGGQKLVEAPQKENIIAKSLDKLKETSTDVWQGTQLLAIDVVAATVLIKRALTGDELAEKEKKALQRTLTDLASVVPIGILMLLPVTAVGHAAMLAAIQRYVPALIPSTYGPERLDLLRQLEKVKEMETGEVKSDENEQ